MNKYKYYNLADNNKETVGIVKSSDLYNANILASELKRMPLDKFKNIFGVEKLDEDGEKQPRVKKTI
jgi:hypothetical protein